MSTLLTAALVFASCIIAVLVITFFVEVVAAFFWKPSAQEQFATTLRGRVTVLVPAHNEQAGLRLTLEDLRSQLGPGDRVLVVADNCTDDTASVARAAGAHVVERVDPDRRGKGYALHFGISHLRYDPPDVLIVVDADCRVARNTVDQLVRACMETSRPVQALDVMVTPAGLAMDRRVAEFAWRVKNWVRPLGLKVLGLPCQLMGTGMAFPWALIRDVNLASGHLVEDLKLGLDLARDGHAAIFCPSAMVTSEFPSSVAAAETQRQRWEGGHLAMSATVAVPLILTAVLRPNKHLFALALDVAVPPLTILALSTIGTFIFSALAFVFNLSPLPLVISGASLAAFMLAVLLCWLKFGRDLLPFHSLGAVGGFGLSKLRLYVGIVQGRRRSQWIRTERATPEKETDDR